jgi:phospholipase C
MAIEHVVVLCLENRSFDHMLGWLEHPDPAFEGLRGADGHANPGWDGGPAVLASPAAKRVLPFGPDHSHDAVMEQLAVTGSGAHRRAANSGFVTSYERKARGLAPPAFGGLLGSLLNVFTRRSAPGTTAAGRGPLVMECQSPERVPVLARLALQFAVCDHWFCSVPGETWPNRNFLHAATSDGETDIQLRPYTDRTVFELLEDADRDWRVYHDDTPQLWAFPRLWDTPARHANWHPTEHFAREVAAGELATYTFIEPNHRPPLHTLDHEPGLGGTPSLGNSQHPENNLVPNDDYDAFDDSAVATDFARAERLVATVYEALRARPDLFARTLLVITYDEHGGFYDHVPPPVGVPAPGDPRSTSAALLGLLWRRKAQAFDFTMLGPRVPTVLVSPLIPAGTLWNRVHDHASVPATLRALFAPDATALTRRDAWSATFADAASLPQPRTDLPDLSASTTAPVAPAPVGPQPGQDTFAREQAPQPVPDYYQEFLRQADQVRARLDEVGEPEVAAAGGVQGAARGAAITAAFAAAAHRHRHG